MCRTLKYVRVHCHHLVVKGAITREMGAVFTRDELSIKCQEWRKQGLKLVTTNGCFDILHVGHVRSLKAARSLGDVLIVGLNSDASVRKLKGANRPILPQDERAEILSSLSSVDAVTIFDEDTPVEFLKVVKPDIHAKGSDYDRSRLAETPVVESFGGKVELLDLVPQKSTTNIIERIQKELTNK